jgi:hypothetical protein
MKLMLVKAGQWREHLLLPLNHRKMGRAKMDRKTRKEFEQVWNSIDKVLRKVVNLEDDHRYLETQSKVVKDRIDRIIKDLALLATEGGDHQELIYSILRSLSEMHPKNFKPHPMDEYFEESKGGEYKEFMDNLTDKEKLEHNPDEFKYLNGESDTKSEDDKK